MNMSGQRWRLWRGVWQKSGSLRIYGSLESQGCISCPSMSLADWCSQYTSCTACIGQRPSAGVDTGERCVWCPSTNGCRVYIRHSFEFPCLDAMRGGGGYPGGADCNSKQGHISASYTPMPMLRDSIKSPYEPFVYKPMTAQPVSVVVASFARTENTPHALHWLWQLEPLKRTGSEVLISHGSKASFAQRHAIDQSAAALCAAKSSCGGARARHLNSTALNARWYTAHRFFAALQSKTDVVLHIDDDLVPGEPMLQVANLRVWGRHTEV
jgi:hypothetical protein